MNPDPHETTPSFDLPAVLPEQAQAVDYNPVSEKQSAQFVEQNVSQQNPVPVAQTQAADPTPQATPQAQAQTADVGASGVAALPAGWMPQIADDTDLIEKEWVDKAKEIVARTAQDPYTQNREMNKIKADYLKKRYNKDIKLSD